MAFAYSPLLDAAAEIITTIATSAGAVYTNPAATTSYVRCITIHNTYTSAEAVSLYLVPDNAGAVGTAGNANKFFYESVPANDTRIIEFPAPGLMLVDENDTIQASTTTASRVTISITGATE
jgi:hypothetical protein